jgi:phosphoglycerol transferase MdoB-like AlkP superfamily enzyme
MEDKGMNKLFKYKVILPIILGIIIGGLLFAFGEYDDKPWYSAIGYLVAAALFFIGLLRIRVFQ